MGQPVDQSGAQHFVLDHLVSPAEGEVVGDDGGTLAGPEREVVEQQLAAFLVEADIAELVAHDQVEALEAQLYLPECHLWAALPYLGQQVRHRGEHHRVAFHAGLDAECCGQVGLVRAGVAVEYGVAAFPDEVERLQLVKQGARFLGKLVPLQLLEVFQLREVGPFHPLVLAVLDPLFDLQLKQFTQERRVAMLQKTEM